MNDNQSYLNVQAQKLLDEYKTRLANSEYNEMLRSQQLQNAIAEVNRLQEQVKKLQEANQPKSEEEKAEPDD